MFKLELEPRFNDTDALGHINNATYLSWFEQARKPLFKIFNPKLDLKKWNLIIARIEIDYLGQGDYCENVILETQVEKIGNSSVVLIQTAFQSSKKIAQAKTVMVYFDYEKNKATPLTEELKNKLTEHLVE